MNPRFLNLRDGGNLPRSRPGLIRGLLCVPAFLIIANTVLAVLFAVTL